MKTISDKIDREYFYNEFMNEIIFRFIFDFIYRLFIGFLDIDILK